MSEYNSYRKPIEYLNDISDYPDVSNDFSDFKDNFLSFGLRLA